MIDKTLKRDTSRLSARLKDLVDRYDQLLDALEDIQERIDEEAKATKDLYHLDHIRNWKNFDAQLNKATLSDIYAPVRTCASILETKLRWLQM